jgi:hypothetical protein
LTRQESLRPAAVSRDQDHRITHETPYRSWTIIEIGLAIGAVLVLLSALLWLR